LACHLPCCNPRRMDRLPPKDHTGDVALLRFLARAGLIAADVAGSAEAALTANGTMCPQCGAALHANCGSCGARLRICPHCGTSVPEARTAANGVPAVPVPAAPAPPVTAASPPPKGFRVLVVDDQEDQREMIAFTLENTHLPLSMTTAANGQEALDLAQADPPDLILLDIMMPDIDGFEVCTRLRADVRTASIPIIMLTALADDIRCEQGLRAGTDDHIRKPFGAADLLARVKRILERTYGASFRPPSAGGIGVEPCAPSAGAG